MDSKPTVLYHCPFCDAVNYVPQEERAGNCTACGKPYPYNQADNVADMVELLKEIRRIYDQDDSRAFYGYEWLFNKIGPILAKYESSK